MMTWDSLSSKKMGWAAVNVRSPLLRLTLPLIGRRSTNEASYPWGCYPVKAEVCLLTLSIYLRSLTSSLACLARYLLARVPQSL